MRQFLAEDGGHGWLQWDAEEELVEAEKASCGGHQAVVVIHG